MPMYYVCLTLVTISLHAELRYRALQRQWCVINAISGRNKNHPATCPQKNRFRLSNQSLEPAVQELARTEQRPTINRNHRPRGHCQHPPPPEQGQEGQEEAVWVWDPKLPPRGSPVLRRCHPAVLKENRERQEFLLDINLVSL